MQIQPVVRTQGYNFREAVAAVRALMRDPNDVIQVFNVINAMPGRSMVRAVRRMRQSTVGSRLMQERPSMEDALSDRDRLRGLPDGTLGREYLRFVEAENISAEGLIAVDHAPPDRELDVGFIWRWLRDTHDIWHVVTGYHGDLLGEAALQAFNFVQIGIPGVGLIVSGVFLRGRMVSKHMRQMILEGFWRGMRSSWLPATDWVSMLPLPLEEVRRRTRVPPGRPYRPVRVSDLPGGKLSN